MSSLATSSIATSSIHSGSTTTKLTSSSKPWFLTFNPSNKDVLIWKSGIRLKLSDGTTTERVLSAAVSSQETGMLTVKVQW